MAIWYNINVNKFNKVGVRNMRNDVTNITNFTKYHKDRHTYIFAFGCIVLSLEIKKMVTFFKDNCIKIPQGVIDLETSSVEIEYMLSKRFEPIREHYVADQFKTLQKKFSSNKMGILKKNDSFIVIDDINQPSEFINNYVAITHISDFLNSEFSKVREKNDSVSEWDSAMLYLDRFFDYISEDAFS